MILSNSGRAPRIGSTLVMAWWAILCSACTSTATKEPAAGSQVDVQHSVGFTITESAKIAEQSRADYDEAMILLQQNRLDEGVDLLEMVVDAAPALSAPRIDLGIALRRTGDTEAAEKHLLLALESSPQHAIAHNELGILYRETGRFQDARRSYEAALDVYPNYHYARRNLAVLCDLYLGDLQCAMDNYESYMTTVFTDKEVSMWMADLENRLKETKR